METGAARDESCGHSIYSESWQLLEERVDLLDDQTWDRVAQQVWGTRHVDDAVHWRVDDTDGGSDGPDGPGSGD